MGPHSSIRRWAPTGLTRSLVLALAALGALVGCASDQTVNVYHSTSITKGRELTDLQRALQEGAITQSEYEGLRRVILRRPN